MIKEAVNEKELLENANQGNTISMLQYGNHLMKVKRTDEAVQWWERAAEGGRAGAAYNLARYYSGLDTGIGDGPKMQEWLTRLAYVHNDGWGMLQMGILMCGGTHQIWKRTIAPEAFNVPRNIEEGLRLIIQGVKQAEATTRDLTLYDYDAAAEIVRAYSGPLGVEVLKLALAYKTKARGMIPPGYTAMSEAAGNVIMQLQSEITQTPAKTMLPARVEVVPRTTSGETPRSPTRVMAAPVTRARAVPRHVPPLNDTKRRDPRAGFGLRLQVTLAGVFLVLIGVLLAVGTINFNREEISDIVQLRVLLYGILAVAAIFIGSVSCIYRWGALGSGKGIFTLVILGGLYSAVINTIYEQSTTGWGGPLWEIFLNSAGTAVITGLATGLLAWMTVRIYDHPRLTKIGKFTVLLFLATTLGGAFFYILWQVDNVLVEIIISPFRSIPFVWIALLPGILLLRWAEDA